LRAVGAIGHDPPVRIVTWNCREGFARKWPFLADLDFDVAVVQECGPLEPRLDEVREVTQVMRCPLPGGRKHFGALARGPWRVDPLPIEEATTMPWLVPVAVTGPVSFTLLSVWAQTPPPDYEAQTRRVATEVIPILDGPIVLAGDLNAPGHSGTRSLRRYLETADVLEKAGLVNAFTSARRMTPREAHADVAEDRPSPALSEPTHYHLGRPDRQWHIDHINLPKEWAASARTTISSYADWIANGLSDHVPVIVDIDRL
jgi:hypothetical protein